MSEALMFETIERVHQNFGEHIDDIVHVDNEKGWQRGNGMKEDDNHEGPEQFILFPRRG